MGEQTQVRDTQNADTAPLAVDMHGITKVWPGVVANDHVNFSVRKGEIHALVGENGAGKTTLMNILYGLIKPTSGEIFVNGQRAQMNSPRDAIARGIGMVHPMLPMAKALLGTLTGMVEGGTLFRRLGGTTKAAAAR